MSFIYIFTFEGLISVLNSTVFPQLSHTLLLTTAAQPERKYSLSIIRGDEENEYVIIAKVSDLIMDEHNVF